MRKFTDETIAMITFCTVLIVLLLFVIGGCTSLPLEDKCHRSALAGKLIWYNEYTGNMIAFQDDCSGSIIMLACHRYFSYEMIDFNTVKVIFEDVPEKACLFSKNQKQVETCSFNMEHMLDIKEEVLDISCSWNGEMNQFTRSN